MEIFTGNFINPTVDADVGEIICGPGSETTDIGKPWSNTVGNHYAVAVALNRDGNGDCLIPVAILETGLSQTVYLCDPVSVQDVSIIRLPKVAACHFAGADPQFIEISIIFQFWDEIEPVNPPQGWKENWETGLIRMWFDPDEFPSGGQPVNQTFETVKEYLDDSYLYDNIHPDIAYDPNTGDLYMISVVNNMGDADLFFTLGERDPIGLTTVKCEYIVFAQDTDDSTLNSFSPRIDIGKIDFLDYSGKWMIAFAYTGHNTDLGWHVRLNYWSLDETGVDPENYRTNDIGWADPLFYPFPAGMPVLDIGPPGSNHAAMVWNQAKTDEWSNSTVMYADTHNGYISYTRLHPDPSWPAVCSAMPSVAVHEYSGSGDYRASVSFLYCGDYVTGIWRPAAVRIETGEESNNVDIGITQLIQMSPFAWSLGKWDSGATVEHNYGISTALTIYGNNYWMLWSAFNPDPLFLIGGPTSVYAAWGNTD